MEYPRPAWRPVSHDEIQWIVDHMSKYTNNAKNFAVLERGTVVFAPDEEPNDLRLATCTGALLDVVTCSPDFTVRDTRDGNFIVQFRGRVFALVSREFYERNSEWISEGPKLGVLAGETFLKRAEEITPQHEEIGLFARANLYLDVEAPRIAARFPAR